MRVAGASKDAAKVVAREGGEERRAHRRRHAASGAMRCSAANAWRHRRKVRRRRDRRRRLRPRSAEALGRRGAGLRARGRVFDSAEHVTAGVLVDGKPLRGAHGLAARSAGSALNPVEREDYRRFGGLEAEVAAAGIVRRFVWRIKSGDQSTVADRRSTATSRGSRADRHPAGRAQTATASRSRSCATPSVRRHGGRQPGDDVRSGDASSSAACIAPRSGDIMLDADPRRDRHGACPRHTPNGCASSCRRWATTPSPSARRVPPNAQQRRMIVLAGADLVLPDRRLPRQPS